MSKSATFTRFQITHDMVTRWAFLAVKHPNSPQRFEVHRPGCRDLRKTGRRNYAITREDALLGQNPVPPSEGPDEAEIARVIAHTFYGGDETAVDRTEVRRMPCLRVANDVCERWR